jgi:fatty-acyl-CoA synthase
MQMRKLTHSYVQGSIDVPLIEDTIGGNFDKAAAQWPANEALVVKDQNVRWTYSQLHTYVDEFAAGLLALGLEPATASAFGRQTTRSGL